MSWSPGAVHLLTIGFYSDAWSRLTGLDVAKFANATVSAASALEAKAYAALASLLAGAGEPKEKWRSAEDLMERLWGTGAEPGAAPFVRDWTRSLFTRAAGSGMGRSARHSQRRLKCWTGLSRSELQAHARIEELFERTHASQGTLDLARVAAEAGYADQSHMGREFKRLTGASPALSTNSSAMTSAIGPTACSARDFDLAAPNRRDCQCVGDLRSLLSISRRADRSATDVRLQR